MKKKSGGYWAPDEKAFIQLIKEIADRSGKRAGQVMDDAVEMMAIAHSKLDLRQAERREDRYLQIIRSYQHEADRMAHPELMAILMAMLEKDPRDVLGPIYVELGQANGRLGQIFTPPALCRLMASMTFEKGFVTETIAQNGFISVCEPACGAGAR